VIPIPIQPVVNFGMHIQTPQITEFPPIKNAQREPAAKLMPGSLSIGACPERLELHYSGYLDANRELGARFSQLQMPARTSVS